MNSLYYRIELQDDVVLSANSATTEHRTLDYIPGSVLLGSLASKAYAAFDDDTAFNVFHAGKVRFLNAYPDCALPSPLSWHHAKGEIYLDKKGQIDQDKLFDLSRVSHDALGSRQPKQMRDGYVNQSRRLHKATTSFRLKTAIDPATGRAKDAQLFGYEHLQQGQVFYGAIAIDEDISTQTTQTIKDKLQGMQRIGRSKNSQYGRATLSWLEEPLRHLDYPPLKSLFAGDQLTVWCLSDCCLLDPITNQPQLQLLPEHLGIDATLDKNRTFIRTRRYLSYNGYRRSYDLERQVVSRGSIVSFRLKQPLDSQQQQQLTFQGVGLYREQGLGQIAINHPWLAADYTAVDSPAIQTASTKPLPADSILCQWLVKQKTDDSHLQPLVDDSITDLKRFYLQSRRYQGIADNQPSGLSNTQWGQLLDIAKNNRTAAGLERALFDNKNALCKQANNDEWQAKIHPDGGSFGSWLKNRLERLKQNPGIDDYDLSRVLIRIAKAAKRNNHQWLLGKGLEATD